MSSPVHKIRFGNLSVTIWQNIGEKGNYFTALPSRSYKQRDGKWRDADRLGFDDLLAMAKLLDHSHTWIAERMQADSKARREADSGDE